MGRKLIYILSTIVLSLLIIRLVFYLGYSDNERVILKILKTKKETLLVRFLGYMTSFDKAGFIVEDLGNINVNLKYVLDDRYGGNVIEYYYLKIDNTFSGFLKASVGYRYSESHSKTFHNVLSKIIDINLFNEYIRVKKISSKDSIIKTYIHFFDYRNIKKYNYILSKDDLYELLEKRPSYNFHSNELDISTLNINFSEGLYYWSYDYGLLKFDFLFDQYTLKSVNIECIGYLGNENLGI